MWPRSKVRIGGPVSHTSVIVGCVSIVLIAVAGVVMLAFFEVPNPYVIIVSILGFAGTIITNMMGTTETTGESQKTRHDIKDKINTVLLNSEISSKIVEQLLNKFPDPECFPRNRDQFINMVSEIINVHRESLRKECADSILQAVKSLAEEVAKKEASTAAASIAENLARKVALDLIKDELRKFSTLNGLKI